MNKFTTKPEANVFVPFTPAVDYTPEVVKIKVEEEVKAKSAEGTPLTIIKPTLSADEKARAVANAKTPNAFNLTDEEAKTLANLRVQGTLNQEQVQEYHRLLNIVGE